MYYLQSTKLRPLPQDSSPLRDEPPAGPLGRPHLQAGAVFAADAAAHQPFRSHGGAEGQGELRQRDLMLSAGILRRGPAAFFQGKDGGFYTISAANTGR